MLTNKLNNAGPMVISLQGAELTTAEKTLLPHHNIGGIILFSRNFENKPQITKLIDDIKSINPNIIVMVDHEGGAVWRFNNHQFNNPGAMNKLGELYDTNPIESLKLSHRYGYQIALELKECGIDLNLAPIIDLNHNNVSTVIGNRAFHANPHIVAQLTAKFIQGQQEAGMHAVGKHFPGHGAIVADSHLTTAIDNRAFATIANQDLQAFKILIEGDPELDIPANSLPAIMPAHVIYSQVDANPAGFSKKWLQDILRTQLNFQGTIISDCLSMQAVGDFANLSQNQTLINSLQDKLKLSPQQATNLFISQTAIAAGCNLVIFNKLHGDELKSLLTSVRPNSINHC
jgi:beta-N-acetylhexosaminidase